MLIKTYSLKFPCIPYTPTAHLKLILGEKYVHVLHLKILRDWFSDHICSPKPAKILWFFISDLHNSLCSNHFKASKYGNEDLKIKAWENKMHVCIPNNLWTRFWIYTMQIAENWTCFVLCLYIINTFLKNNRPSRPRGSWITDQNIILTVLMLFLSTLDNFLQDVCIIFQISVDNFEVAHKTCLF